MQRLIHPFHAVLLAGTVTLFLGALVSDVAYDASYQIQWKNFASWLIVGGLFVGGAALAWSLVELRHAGPRRAQALVYALLLLATWILGFVNASVHTRDAWASMPTGLVLSVVVALLAVAATTLGFSRLRAEVLT